MISLREIFDAAVDIQSTEERSRYLDQVCGADLELRRELDGLLAAHDSDSALLDGPAVGLLFKPPQPAFGNQQQIGSYRIVRELGGGGMGVVFLAERQIGKARQTVALKLIRSSLASNDEILRRFEQEREILASLDHPNIARLLDVGTAEGVPYFVMDYIEGEPIDEYCQRNEMDLARKLVLFRDACAAVDYAHTRGVVHRDLKPSNILVTTAGQVKLLDFGIAKIVREDSDVDQTLLTRAGSAVMTLEYASPEQVRGEAIGTASDIYSLGVVLYELLTRSRPFEMGGRLPHEVARAICEDQPLAPSTAVVQASQSHPLAREMRRELSGDLDAIVLKALRKEPQWRYSAVSELSDDVARHTAGERVLARADTMRYRAERIVRRLLNPSDGVFHDHGWLMVSAGIVGGILLIERQRILWGVKSQADVAINVALLSVWFAWSLYEGRRMASAGKMSALDRNSWIVFSVITIAVGLLTIATSRSKLIPAAAMAVFWVLSLGSGLVIVGLQASKLMTACGTVLLMFALCATFFSDYVYLVLAIGLSLGMTLPGAALLVQNHRVGRR